MSEDNGETVKTAWQLFVYGIGGKCAVIHGIDPNGTVDRLVDAVIDKICNTNGIPATTNTTRILYTSKQLEYGCQYPLSKYNITDRSSLFLVLRLQGGQDGDGTAHGVPESENGGFNDGDSDGGPDVNGLVLETDVVVQQQGRKEHHPTTPLTELPDMITFDDGKDFPRARMPCGHAIGAESLTAYCRSLLAAGKFEFCCPYTSPENNSICDKKWDFQIVRQYGVLTPDEIKDFELKISLNYMRKATGFQACPSCSTVCERINSNAKRVTCLYCSRDPNPKFEFCWMCLGEWLLKSSVTVCGNRSCSGRDHRLDILETCPKKSVVGVVCPSIRACPACGRLIEHADACKHMSCPCSRPFCFLCLKQPAGGGWTCGSYNSPCAVAPVQTTLPGAGVAV